MQERNKKRTTWRPPYEFEWSASRSCVEVQGLSIKSHDLLTLTSFRNVLAYNVFYIPRSVATNVTKTTSTAVNHDFSMSSSSSFWSLFLLPLQQENQSLQLKKKLLLNRMTKSFAIISWSGNWFPESLFRLNPIMKHHHTSLSLVSVVDFSTGSSSWLISLYIHKRHEEEGKKENGWPRRTEWARRQEEIKWRNYDSRAFGIRVVRGWKTNWKNKSLLKSGQK